MLIVQHFRDLFKIYEDPNYVFMLRGIHSFGGDIVPNIYYHYLLGTI